MNFYTKNKQLKTFLCNKRHNNNLLGEVCNAPGHDNPQPHHHLPRPHPVHHTFYQCTYLKSYIRNFTQNIYHRILFYQYKTQLNLFSDFVSKSWFLVWRLMTGIWLSVVLDQLIWAFSVLCWRSVAWLPGWSGFSPGGFQVYSLSCNWFIGIFDKQESINMMDWG